MPFLSYLVFCTTYSELLKSSQNSGGHFFLYLFRILQIQNVRGGGVWPLLETLKLNPSNIAQLRKTPLIMVIRFKVTVGSISASVFSNFSKKTKIFTTSWILHCISYVHKSCAGHKKIPACWYCLLPFKYVTCVEWGSKQMFAVGARAKRACWTGAVDSQHGTNVEGSSYPCKKTTTRKDLFFWF